MVSVPYARLKHQGERIFQALGRQFLLAGEVAIKSALFQSCRI
jgi:hypothetical protein